MKNCSTAKAADAAVRKALKQIAPNPGGIVIEFDDKVNLNEAIDVINDRMGRSMNDASPIDVMIVQKKTMICVLSFEK